MNMENTSNSPDSGREIWEGEIVDESPLELAPEPVDAEIISSRQEADATRMHQLRHELGIKPTGTIHDLWGNGSYDPKKFDRSRAKEEEPVIMLTDENEITDLSDAQEIK